MGDVNVGQRVGQLFGGKPGNRGKGRPKGSRNRRTAADRAREQMDAERVAAENRLARMRLQLEEERTRQELEDLRTPRRRREPSRPSARTNQDVLVQVLGPIAAAFAPMAAQIAQQMVQGPKVLQEQPAALPAAQAQPQQAATPATPQPAAPSQPTGKLKDSIEGKWLRSMCESKGAQGLAAWLVTADDERARVIVQHICSLPDEQLPQLWASVVQGSPGLAAFCAWLQAWPKYPEAVQAVRMLHAQQQQQAAGAAAPPA